MSIINYCVSKHYAGSMVSDRCPLGYLSVGLNTVNRDLNQYKIVV